jgi:enamine deaminase RidA (YjgF/YER057c/UK114 family)
MDIATLNMGSIPTDVPPPLGNYLAVSLSGNTGYVSGQFPLRDGEMLFQGKLGGDLGIEQGKQAACLAALNALGQIRNAMGSRFAQVHLVRVDAFIASAPGFIMQPTVLDGASDTLVAVLGERGRHARTVVAVPQLPGNAPIELVVIFHVAE